MGIPGGSYLLDTKLKVDSLQQRVYQRLKRNILTNRYKPGRQMNIDQLANELGVSQTPVREALAMLKHDGLVVTDYYKTPMVSMIEEDDVREVYEIRKLLEGYAIESTGANLTDEDLSAMRAMLSIPKGIEDIEVLEDTLTETDIEFHSFIAAKIKNSIYYRFFQTIDDLSLRIRTLVLANTARNVEITISEHTAILEALEKKDVNQAVKAVYQHLDNACGRTLEAIKAL